MNKTIRELTRLLQGQLIMGDPKSQVSRASCDSRKVQMGDLFFALKGAQLDGHDFVRTACREGAKGVVVSQLNWMMSQSQFDGAVIQVTSPEEALKKLARHIRAGFKGAVVGITGSNGKTTTKQMVKSILETKAPGLATVGNYNSQIGLPLVLSELSSEHRWMVLEMGASEPGNIASLCDIARPNVGVLTSLGPAHLATFGSLEKIAETKWELMESLPSDGTAIVPWGVSQLEPLIRKYKNKIIFFGEDSACSIKASKIEVGEKVRFRLHIGSSAHEVQLPVSGRMNVKNALAAAGAGWALGYDLAQIAAGLESFEPPAMRMQVIHHDSGAILINDAYNANPSSMMEAIRSLVETYPDRKRIIVLGSMLELGPDSNRWHFHVGTELSKFPLESVFLLGEETAAIQDGAVSSHGEKEKFVMAKDHSELAGSLKKILAPDAVVLFKGSRGLQLEKVLNAL